MSESLKHEYAKNTVARWLRTEVADNGETTATILECSPNREAPFYGIYPEYPICVDDKGDLLGLNGYPWDERLGYIPSYQQCLDHGWLPLVIFDIGILHKGDLRCAVEIVHTNPVSPEKWRNISRIADESNEFGIHVLDAANVLARSRPPKALANIIGEWKSWV